MKQGFGRALSYVGITRSGLEIAMLRKKFSKAAPGSLTAYRDYTLRITDGPSCYIQLKDEFVHQIYRFESQRPDPLIIDGGSNIGVSILFFKHIYPKARIIGFEPDPNIFRMLNENVTRNALKDVSLVDAGLGAKSSVMNFIADNSAGGKFGNGENSISAKVVRLSDYLNEPVDFLKLNIEGQELPVLVESQASGRLRNIREMVIEYHGWAGGDQRLGPILELLDSAGYRYLVHDFDHETGSVTKPPFQSTLETNWFCLIYAKRVET